MKRGPNFATYAETLARRFHENYERLAPAFGYKTRAVSAVAWERVPQKNKALMVAVCQTLITEGIELPPHEGLNA